MEGGERYFVTEVIPFDFFSRYSHILKPLGLSDYEIRVFLTLLVNGPMNYKVLGQESSVPTGKIYVVLSSLESKGFIETIQEKPKVFKAAEPKKALRRRLRQIEDDYFELELKTKEALLTLQNQYNLKYDIIQGVVSEIFVGNTSFVNKVRENLLKAEDEVLVSSDGQISGLNEKDLFGSLIGRGVSVRAIFRDSVGKDTDFFNNLLELGINIRLMEPLPAKYFVVDEKSVSLVIEGSAEPTCVQISSAPLCRVLRERFVEAWDRAKPAKRELSTKKVLSSFRLFE
jgi:sugar-specific transcriptional regulator TrmB